MSRGLEPRYPYTSAELYRVYGNMKPHEAAKIIAKHIMLENQGQITEEQAIKIAEDFGKKAWGVISDGTISMNFGVLDPLDGYGCCMWD